MVFITREFIEKHRTSRGGFTFAQCKALGAGWPPRKGWIDRAVKIDHTEEAVAMFVEFASRAKTKPERRAQRKDRRNRLSKLEQKPPKLILKCDPASNQFLSTFEWRAVRMQVLKRYGPKCQCCGAEPPDVKIHVDHIKPRKLFPHLALDVDNLQILCEDCNHGKGNWDQTDWRQEDQDPDVIAFLKDIAKNG